MARPSGPAASGGIGQMSASNQATPMNQLGQLNAMNHGATSSGPIVRPSNAFGFGAPGTTPPVAAPSRSNALVFVLIAILVAAISVLAYLVLTK
jgi:hypothetical protein